MSALSDESIDALLAKYKGATFSTVKQDLAELTISVIAPIRARMQELIANPAQIDQALIRGANRARALAQDNMKGVYNLIGIEKV